MTAADVFARAAAYGEPLNRNDARVARAENTPESRRVWLGSDFNGLPVAYFETPELPTDDYAVSRTIAVSGSEFGLEHSERSVTAVKLLCLEPHLTAVFQTFVDDLLRQLHDCDSVPELIQRSAADWRTLLQVANSGLSQLEATGLYGELRFLEDAVEAIGPSALESWQRSPQDAHDFINDGVRVEVKTSRFQDRSAVTIHGLRQLEPPTNAVLILAVAEVQPHGTGDTIDDVVRRLLAQNVDSEQLTKKLADAGFVSGMPGAGHTFTLLTWRFWQINAETAVLNRSTVGDAVADGVSDLSYVLNLSALGEPRGEFDWAAFGGTESRGDT